MKYFHHRHLETYRVSRTTWKQGLYRKLIHRKTHLQHTTNKLDLVFEVKHANRWLQTKEEVRGLKWSEPPPWTLMRFLLQCRSHISSQLKGCLLSIKMRTRTTHKWTNTIHKARRLCVTETLQRLWFPFLVGYWFNRCEMETIIPLNANGVTCCVPASNQHFSPLL